MADMFTSLDRALRRNQGAPMPYPPFALKACCAEQPDTPPLPELADPNPIERDALGALKVADLRLLAPGFGVEAGGCKAELVERIAGRSA